MFVYDEYNDAIILTVINTMGLISQVVVIPSSVSNSIFCHVEPHQFRTGYHINNKSCQSIKTICIIGNRLSMRHNGTHKCDACEYSAFSLRC